MKKKEKDLSLAFEDNLKKRLFIARFGTKGNYKSIKEELDLLIAEALDDYKNSDDAARWIENKISESIAEHENSKWKPYPENKPEPYRSYWVHTENGSEFHTVGVKFDDNRVIAFHEILKYKPYNPERREG